MSGRERDPKGLDDATFDAELAAIFGEARGRDVPVALHGRVVRSIEAAGGRRRRWLARLAGVAIAGAIVLAVAAAALPWLQRSAFPIVASSPTPTAGATRAAIGPSASASATSSATLPSPTSIASATPPEGEQSGGVKAIALGPGDLTLDISEVGIQKIACGESHGFVGNGPFPWHVTASNDTSSTSIDIGAGQQYWIVGRPIGWEISEAAPKDDLLFAFCSTTTDGTAAGGRLRWYEGTAKVVGTPADATITAGIKHVVDARLQYLRDWVTQTPEMTSTFESTVHLRDLPLSPRVTGADVRPYLNQNSLLPGLAAMDVTYAVDVPQANHGPLWTDVLVFDLRDGHRIAIDELFARPAEALGVLSDWARRDPNLSSFGKDQVWTDGTAPTAANFAMWAPTAEGLEITFAANQVGPSALGMPKTVVPWSAIEPLLKPDSPVRNVVP